MATNSYYKGKAGNKNEEVEFHNIVFWGRTAEIIEQYLMKGQEVSIEGRIQTQQYDDKQGVRKYRTQIIGQNLQLGQRPKNAENIQQPTAQNQEEALPTVDLDEEEVKAEDIPF